MRLALVLLIVLIACTPVDKVPATGGEQNPTCICTAQYAPVCGSDGVTYSNSCFAGCAKVTYSDGPCAS